MGGSLLHLLPGPGGVPMRQELEQPGVTKEGPGVDGPALCGPNWGVSIKAWGVGNLRWGGAQCHSA